MHEGTFIFKVSDILLHSGSHHTITFLNILSTKLPGLQETGITGTLELKNLNKTEILLIITEATADISSCCDRCGKEFIEKRHIEEVVTQAKVMKTPSLTEDILTIDQKDLTVDLEDFFIDQFLLHQSLKTLCINCEQNPLGEDEDIDYVSLGVKRH